MSEPMSLPEVEDVVSSIRRLVSPDHRPLTRILPEKLLLTPALQVVIDAGPNPEPNLEAMLEPELAQMPSSGLAREQLLETDLESETALVVDIPILDDVGVPVSEETLHVEDAEWGDEIWLEPEQTLADIAEQIEDAEVVFLPDAKQEVTSDTLPIHLASTDGRQQFETDPAEEAPIRFATNFSPVTTLPDDAIVGATADLTIKADASSESTLSVFDPEDMVAPLGEDVQKDDEFPRRVEINEDVLQAMVRELIRDELHGVLGERITRNVRKLVRAEINRALAARSFD